MSYFTAVRFMSQFSTSRCPTSIWRSLTWIPKKLKSGTDYQELITKNMMQGCRN
ncbi:unnamed protein product [Linum tenue]|uniref:Uncharacterized protein n=1 Tax=Linum tenue TaxID=586396 RepID=A0AAV0Q0U4_9ROSI|nr:unnamed protein product [Linum tenue]